MIYTNILPWKYQNNVSTKVEIDLGEYEREIHLSKSLPVPNIVQSQCLSVNPVLTVVSGYDQKFVITGETVTRLVSESCHNNYS